MTLQQTTIDSPVVAPAELVLWRPDAAPRGAVLVLGGRGDVAGHYARLGRRLSADGYLVAVTPETLRSRAELAAHWAELEALENAGLLRVAVAVDTAAGLLAGAVADEQIAVDGLVLAGAVVPDLDGSDSASRLAALGTTLSAEEQIALRTACPLHARVIAESTAPALASESVRVKWPSTAVRFPTLVLHGGADAIEPPELVERASAAWPRRELVTVRGGRHDVLNDSHHRSVAAELVSFLERLRADATAPAILDRVPAASVSASFAPFAGSTR